MIYKWTIYSIIYFRDFLKSLWVPSRPPAAIFPSQWYVPSFPSPPQIFLLQIFSFFSFSVFLLLHKTDIFLLRTFSSFSFSDLINQNVMKPKVQFPHSIQRTFLVKVFGLVIPYVVKNSNHYIPSAKVVGWQLFDERKNVPKPFVERLFANCWLTNFLRVNANLQQYCHFPLALALAFDFCWNEAKTLYWTRKIAAKGVFCIKVPSPRTAWFPSVQIWFGWA